MMRTGAGQLVLMALVVAACGRRDDKPSTQDRSGTAAGAATGIASSNTEREPVKYLTPHDLLAQGTPTIVVGTLGADAADRAIVAQARLPRAVCRRPHRARHVDRRRRGSVRVAAQRGPVRRRA